MTRPTESDSEALRLLREIRLDLKSVANSPRAEVMIAKIDALLAQADGMTCEDEGCPHYGTPHGHSVDKNAVGQKISPARAEEDAAAAVQHSAPAAPLNAGGTPSAPHGQVETPSASNLPPAPDNAGEQENKASSVSTGADFKATDSGPGLQAPGSMSRRLPNNPAPAVPAAPAEAPIGSPLPREYPRLHASGVILPPAEAPTPETDELCEHGPGGAAISPHSLPFEILCRRLERQRDAALDARDRLGAGYQELQRELTAALSRERLANMRADQNG